MVSPWLCRRVHRLGWHFDDGRLVPARLGRQERFTARLGEHLSLFERGDHGELICSLVEERCCSFEDFGPPLVANVAPAPLCIHGSRNGI